MKKYILTNMKVANKTEDTKHTELLLFDDYLQLLNFIMKNKSYEILAFEEVSIIKKGDKNR